VTGVLSSRTKRPVGRRAAAEPQSILLTIFDTVTDRLDGGRGRVADTQRARRIDRAALILVTRSAGGIVDRFGHRRVDRRVGLPTGDLVLELLRQTAQVHWSFLRGLASPGHPREPDRGL